MATEITQKELSEKDLQTIILFADYFQEENETYLNLEDDTILLSAMLKDGFLSIEFYIDEDSILLSKKLANIIFDKLEMYKKDVLSVEDNQESLTRKDWTKKLEYFN